jgi:N6-adenosine-specific RNA methylase IME4
MHFEFHPLANLFPLVEGAALDELSADIKANELHEPIDIYQGKILDGRNRYRAMSAAGIKIEQRHVRYFCPELYGDPVAYVISKNLRRRHLNESQRAMVAANLATMRQGERTDVEPSAKLQKVDQKNAAERLSVSPRTVADAVKVRNEAAPEVRHAVEQGKLPVSSAAKLVGLPHDVQKFVAEHDEAWRAARTEIARYNRNERLEEIAAAGEIAPSMPTGQKFSIFYADPPWQFDVWSRETGLEKSPDQHYPTMTVEEICALPVSDLVATGGAVLLFLWITVPHLMRVSEVFRAWGRVVCEDPEYGIIKEPWAYVSNYNWDKVNIGPGRWNRNQHEHLLIAKIGSMPAPLPADRVRSNYSEASTAHSAKPDYFAELIERQYPQLRKIELFRRGPARPGWSAWGNESNQSTNEAA